MILIVYGIILALLVIALLWCMVTIRRFTSTTPEAVVQKQLRALEKELDSLGRTQKTLSQTVDTLSTLGQTHLSKVGFVRFNPFDHTGGEHSFTVALLDSHQCGIVITSLHARQQTRLYAQLVQHGKPNKDATFSTEEQEAIKQALRS